MDSFHVEIRHASEVHTPGRSFVLLAAAKAWTAQTIAELFWDAHVLERDSAAEVVDLVEELEGSGRWVRSAPDIDLRVSIWSVDVDEPSRLDGVPQR